MSTKDRFAALKAIDPIAKLAKKCRRQSKIMQSALYHGMNGPYLSSDSVRTFTRPAIDILSDRSPLIESEVELLEGKGGDLFYLGYKATEVGGSHVGFK